MCLPSVLRAQLLTAFAALAWLLCAVAPGSASAATSLWSHDDARRYITTHFPYIWDESYVAYGPMGVQSAPLEVDRRYTKTYDPKTGDAQYTYSSGLFGYETSSGRVAPIDTSLRRVSGGWSPRGVGYKLRLPARFGGGVVWGDEQSGSPLVTLVPVRSRALRAGNVVGPKLDKVLYPEVWPASDVVMTATGAGLKDHIVVRDIERAPRAYSFIVRRPAGAKTRVASDGGVAVTLQGGESIALMEAPRGQDAKDQDVPLWYTVTQRDAYDVLTLRYSTATRVVNGTWITYQAPLDLDPTLYAEGVQAGVSAWSQTSGHTGTVADSPGGALRVQISKRSGAYVQGAYAQWRIDRPPSGASWHSMSGNIAGRAGANLEYVLSTGGVRKYVRPSNDDPDFFSNHFTFQPPNDESYFVSRIHMTAAASTPHDYYGTLSNLSRTFIDNTNPSKPSISANFGFIAPSTFQATTSFSDGQSGCGGGTIYVISDETGATVRSQSFAGCAATLTFSSVPAGPYTLYVEVRDAAGRTNWNSTWLDVYPAPEVWVMSPLDYDYVDGSVLVSGGVDEPSNFLSGYEIYVDGQLKATIPTSATSFAHVLDTRSIAEGERTLTVAARDIAGSATTWDVPILVDHTAPEVALVEPEDGQHVSGTIWVAADASDTVSEVTKLEFLLDGAVIATRGAEDAFEIELDTLPLAGGAHTLAARATNPLGHVRTSTPRTIIVDNIAPSATIITPADGSSIDGVASFTIAVDDNLTVADARLNLYNSRNYEIPVGSATGAGTYAYTLDTARIQNGTYALELVAADQAGNQTTVEHTITVANPVHVMGSETWLSSSDVGPVNVGHVSGNLHIASSDIDIPALGTSARVKRAYNHQDARIGSFGRGWHASFDRSITIGLDGVATYRDGDGTLHAFYPTDDGVFERAVGVDADLSKLDGGGYTLRSLTGTVEVYDASGRWLKDTSRTGQAITPERDANGNIYRIADDSGLAVRLERNTDGLVTALVDPAGRRTQYAYDADKSLIAVSNPLGAVTRFGYGSTGWLVTHTDALDHATRVQYADGRVTSVTDAAGVETSFTYAAGTVTTTTATRTTKYELDEFGRAAAVTLADGSIQERIYDDAGHLAEYVNGNGDSQAFNYDDAGNLVAESDFSGNVTRYANHDAFGSPRTVTNPVGKVSRYVYDTEGNAIKTIKPGGGQIVAAYDEAGNKLSETDAVGNTTTMTYTAHGHLVRSVAPGNAITSYEINAVGDLLVETAPDGGQTTYTYDATGNQTSSTDAVGNTTTTQYDALGRAVAETDGEGNTTRTEYNAIGNATKVTNPAGDVQTTTYNAFGEAVARTDENGEVTKYAYDAAGNLVVETDPLGEQTTYQVDAAGNIISETTPDGHTTEYVYDADGRVVQTIHPDGSSTETTYRADGSIASETDEEGGVTQYGYNADGDQTSITDPLGHVSQSELNANGDTVAEIDVLGYRSSVDLNEQGIPVRAIDPVGNQTRTVVDVMGNVTASTDANGHTTRYRYDKLSQLKQITDPLGGVYAYTYNANGEITGETDELGRTTTYAYSPTGELIAATDPAGNVDRFTYDAAGNVITDTDADGNTTTYHYDQAGQITASVDPEGLTTRYAYDGDGNLASETDPAGQTTTYTFDSSGRLSTVRDPGGETTIYSYNRSGDLTTITDPAGETTAYAYAAHRVTSQISSLKGTTTYTYTARGELSTITDAAGTTTYTYTALGQLASITLPDGTRTTYTYDPAGNLLTITEPHGTTTYVYDAADRLLSMENPDGTLIEFSYNAASELISQTIDNQTATYTYTSAGLLASQADATGTTHFEYTPAGNLTRLSRPNGASTSYTYDDAGLLLSISDSDGDRHAYEYDPAGQISTARAASGDHAYTYDARSQLTSWIRNGLATLYSYDRRGNMLRIDRTVTSVDQGHVPPGIQTQIETCLSSSFEDCPNPNIRETLQCLTATVPTCVPTQLEGVDLHVARYFANYAVPVRSYSYDAHSRLSTLTDEIAQSSEQFEYDDRGNQTRAGDAIRTYDSENRLASISTPTDTVSYAYDASGLRTSRTHNGQTTRYTYNADDRLIKQVLAGSPTIRFTHVADSLHAITVSEATYFFHFNSRGDTTRLTDSSGATVVRYAYTPWGEITSSGDPDLIAANPFTYNGADGVQYDQTVGLYWMGARHYDPRQSRFLQTDPEVSVDDRADAPYLYTGNDPVNNVDSDGRTLRRKAQPARRVVQPRPRPGIVRRPVAQPTRVAQRLPATRLRSHKLQRKGAWRRPASATRTRPIPNRKATAVQPSKPQAAGSSVERAGSRKVDTCRKTGLSLTLRKKKKQMIARGSFTCNRRSSDRWGEFYVLDQSKAFCIILDPSGSCALVWQQTPQKVLRGMRAGNGGLRWKCGKKYRVVIAWYYREDGDGSVYEGPYIHPKDKNAPKCDD